MKQEVIIKIATKKDAQELLNIYAPYVEKTAITFEYDVPSVEEFADRIENVLEKYPYLIAVRDGKILGYAYVGVFHARAAYDWAVETSIYVDENHKGEGIGGTLHKALENVLKEQGILNLNACIAYPKEPDKYLTKDSVDFHGHLGYRMVGEFYECGYKFDRWYNMVWMEKHIGEHVNAQPPVKKFEDVKESIKEKYNIY